MLNLRKKGELTSGQLITLVLLALGFGILLLLLFRADWTGDADREACHQSILERATFKYKFLDVGSKIPLRCSTQKTCIGFSNQNCNEMISTKENPVETLKLSSPPDNIPKVKTEVMNYIADSMYDCHSMVGEGKINFMPHNVGDINYCIICARFNFNGDFKDKYPNNEVNISFSELTHLLQKKQDSHGVSYAEYLYGIDQPEKLDLYLSDFLKKLSQEQNQKDISNLVIDANYTPGYIIVTQIRTEGYGDAALMASVGSLASFIVGGKIGLGKIGASVLKLSGGVGGLIFWSNYPSDDKNDGFFYSPPSILPYNLEVLKGLNCDFETAP